MFPGPQFVCVPANRAFGLFGHGHSMLPRQQALWCFRGRNSFASLLIGPSDFSGTGIACFPDSRPCDVCGDANRLRPCKPALRSFRARASHASPRIGPAVFTETQALWCWRAGNSFAYLLTGPSVFGHHMLPRQQALRCLRGRNSFSSLLTRPSDFSGTGIACFPDSGPCDVFGPQLVCVPANRPFGFFRARASHASPRIGPAVFVGSQLDCVPPNRPFGLFRFAHRMLPWQQVLQSFRSSTSGIHTLGQLKCVWAAKMH